MAMPKDALQEADFLRTMLAILRMVTGYCFMLHGMSKLFGVPFDERFADLSLFSLMGLAGVLEFFGGLLMLLGLFTRPVAFVLSGMMAVAYFMAHAGWGDFWLPLVNHGEAAVLYCFIFLFLSAAGAGNFSLDNLGRRYD